ncbi:MAG: hypothetical protein A3K19_08635 [Lentisphaerae bacterium RIFOXYB12_FULL_65_16]|nr:MAG: hypothetical protein A3K18_05630 [Lentisphaerae bacterium RIFOXYA12_64_32]OGV89482.1 MAG: hypothetical protein A3K19_08635 [Lentisphaerae bacterium RIFOXYB12_FULL_65_16]
MNVRNTGLLLCAMVGMQSCVTGPARVDAPAPGAMFYVAPGGSDANPGTKAKPFLTLDRARDAIRALKKTGPLPQGGVVVSVRGGVYELARPLEFTAEDSGTEACPIEYRAAKGKPVRIIGGKTVTGWVPVTDPAIVERLDPAARGNVYQADLKALGITDLQGINNAGTYRSDPGLELFFNDKPMTLARYPNEGYMHISAVLDANGVVKKGQADTPEGRFVCDDPRPGLWGREKDIWLHGFWVWDWADMRLPLGSVDAASNTISLAAKPDPARKYNVRKGQWFYAENVLPELDTPGEWYLDRDTSVLYFWPPSAPSKGTAAVSAVRDLFQLNDVANVTFRGLLVEAGRGTAFVIKGGTNVRVVGCTIRNMGNWAVKAYGGTRHGVIGCDVYQTGQGGIHLEGGDRKTLTPAGHYADNNHVHHTSRWDPVYQQAIALRGVGNRATHNLIDHVPHIAIGFADNDMTIEYNEIHSAVFQSNDAGAIYTSPPDETWSMRGHKIRYNYLHNIHGFEGKGCWGVYLDDCFSSADISSNIFYDVAGPILIGGGRDNPITNNMFINCPKAFSIDARGLGWAKGVGTFATKELHDLNYQQPPWSTKYPELLNILSDEPLAPKGNVVARSVCWGGKWGWTEGKAVPLVKFENNLIDEDPRFVGKPPADFRLKDDSPAMKLGFRQIPFREIGLYASPDRASWPVRTVLRQDPVPPPAKPKPPRVAGPAPVFDVPRLPGAVTIDGKFTPEEWFGLDPTKGIVVQEGVEGEKVAFPSKAWLAWDDQALYVAFDNAVSKDIAMERDDAWGANDAIEVSLSNPALGAKAPTLVLRGFTSGKVSSSDEAGAPPDAVRKAGENVQCAAAVIDAGRWVVEMRIPFASLGIDPNANLKFPFNLAVRKQGEDPWVMWRGTGNCTWYVPEAGLIRFVR